MSEVDVKGTYNFKEMGRFTEDMPKFDELGMSLLQDLLAFQQLTQPLLIGLTILLQHIDFVGCWCPSLRHVKLIRQLLHGNIEFPALCFKESFAVNQ